MPKFPVTEIEVDAVVRWLRQRRLKHIRVRGRADTITLESGPETEAVHHARLRRVSVHLWILEMPNGKRWEVTPYRDEKEALLEALLRDFRWMLMPIHVNPARTSGRRY
jgi:hypothetical protein